MCKPPTTPPGAAGRRSRSSSPCIACSAGGGRNGLLDALLGVVQEGQGHPGEGGNPVRISPGQEAAHRAGGFEVGCTGDQQFLEGRAIVRLKKAPNDERQVLFAIDEDRAGGGDGLIRCTDPDLDAWDESQPQGAPVLTALFAGDG